MKFISYCITFRRGGKDVSNTVSLQLSFLIFFFLSLGRILIIAIAPLSISVLMRRVFHENSTKEGKKYAKHFARKRY